MHSSTPVNRDNYLAYLALCAELVNKDRNKSGTFDKTRITTARKQVRTLSGLLIKQANNEGKYAVFITMTYRDANATPEGLSAFMDKLRRWLARKGHAMPYLWVLERGSRLHYHLMVWLPHGVSLPLDKVARWWPHGLTDVGRARKVGACGRYMSKFDGAHTLPRGTRMWGYGGLSEDTTKDLIRSRWPHWLKRLVPMDARVQYKRRVGWVDLDAGEVFKSPYVWTPYGMRQRPAKECEGGYLRLYAVSSGT